MKLERLVRRVPYAVLSGNPDRTEITGICDRSDRVRPGDLFLCLKGLKTDGGEHIREALRRGAGAVLLQKPVQVEAEGLTALLMPELNEYAGIIASAFYGDPSRTLGVTGVTGTNGKTSTAVLLHHILTYAGIKTGMIGTIANVFGDGRTEEAHFTTPQAVELQYLLGRMRDEECRKAVMEVSSHALAQYRDCGIPYELGIFTNLTQDHLDYHGTMEAYAKAKARLFAHADCALLNRDDPAYAYFAAHASGDTYSYGLGKKADFQAAEAEYKDAVRFRWFARGHFLGEVAYPACGRFQVYNVLAAASAAWLLRVDTETIIAALALEKPIVAGRFEQFRMRNGARIIVDFAHTPDGLKEALTAARPLCTGRLTAVFGCGGDRDKSKRALMGRIAGALSDRVILTSDNPRSEDPEAIIRMVEEGLYGQNTPWESVTDRAEAIERAVGTAGDGDVVLIAGKGHEKTQQIGEKKIPFDDRQQVLKAIRKQEG